MRTQAGPDREREFGEFLRLERERRDVALHQVSRTTRIPMRSLEHLEAGAFEKLPADIFVRGFLRSYADCVGLEAGEVMNRYGELGVEPPPFTGDIVAAVRRSRARRQAPARTGEPGNEIEDAHVEPPGSGLTRKRPRTLLPHLSDGDREGRRGPVTVAVIILVIVATLTMSYLLRKPASDSDGFTRADDAAASIG
jgi:hypothetical protein